MDGWMSGMECMDFRNELMNLWMHGWMHEWIDGWMDGWIGGGGSGNGDVDRGGEYIRSIDHAVIYVLVRMHACYL